MNPLINKKVRLEKFAGKGGWTYAKLPVKNQKNEPFGWMRVKGCIDNYEFKNYHLMPMGNGNLFLPVKAQIRKQLKKQAGDWVHVILFRDESELEIPEEFLQCLQDEPSAHKVFMQLDKTEQKKIIDNITRSKKIETRAQKILHCIDELINHKI